MTDEDFLREGRMMSGRLIDRELNFTFTLWGYRPAPPAYIDWAYRQWRRQQRKNARLRNLRVDIHWNG